LASPHSLRAFPPANPQGTISPLARRIFFGTYIRMMDDEILDENLVDDEVKQFETEEEDEETY